MSVWPPESEKGQCTASLPVRPSAAPARTLCRMLFGLAVLPLTLLWMGFSVRNRGRLPQKGPAVIVANHNSHLDALMLMSLFPLRLAPMLCAAAAADYFFRNRLCRFAAEFFAGLVPLERNPRGRTDPLAPLVRALEEERILILFPEGSRGAPEVMGEIKPGLWRLARRCPGVPLYPVYLHGLGRSLPKGAWIPVPLFADICVGEAFIVSENKRDFPEQLRTIFAGLRDQTLAGITARYADEEDQAG